MAFLRAHPGEVSPITISLVLNDVQRFIAECALEPLCIQRGAPATIEQITTNLATIVERFRRAAPNVEIIVLGPDDPFIGNLEFANPLFMALNDAMAKTVASASARYADIFPTFNRRATSTPRRGRCACSRSHARTATATRRISATK